MINSGIYAITNQANGRKYIGSSINLNNRWNYHKRSLRKNKHFNKHLQNSWNKYDEENFVFEVLEEVLCKSKLIEREQFYLDVLKPEYNIHPIADSPLGCRRSEETKKKMSELRKGCRLSEETRKKISLSKFGRPSPMKGKKGKKHSEETKTKMSKAHTGFRRTPHSEETKKKIAQAKQNKVSSFKGKQHTLESKEKIRQKALERKLSNDTKEKISIATSGQSNPMSRTNREKRRMLLQGELAVDYNL